MKNLKVLRKQKKKTQQDMAEMLKITYRTYQNYENDLTEMPYNLLFKLADYFGVSIDYLLGHELNKNNLENQTFEKKQSIFIKLKDLRSELNLTQEQLAQAVGLSRDTYKNYEQQRTEMSYDILFKLADYFGVSIDYLLGHQTEGSNMSESQKEIVEDFKKLISQLTTQQTSFVFDIIKLCLNSPMYKQTL